MAGKRRHQDVAAKSKDQRPSKKQKKQLAYHSDSDEESNPDFNPVNLLDSDDDLDNVAVDDGGASESHSQPSSSDAESSDDETSARDKLIKQKPASKSQPKKTAPRDAPSSSSGEEHDDEDEDEDDEFSDLDAESNADSTAMGSKKSKSKRNNPDAFATSFNKILSTKLSTSKRADPVLSRSVDASAASKSIVDSALERKARKALRQKKLEAMEKGRVKDVLVATRDDATGEEATTQGIMEQERRLRKVAQRGVVRLFNAVRAAQVKAEVAEKDARKEGIVGRQGREEKVNEMSRKGFLDLIASGGGGLKKGALEEA